MRTSRERRLVITSKIQNMSKVRAFYHIVFCTKHRQPTIPLDHMEDVYRFIWKQLENAKCTLLRIGGIQNHVHMLIELHPSISLSFLMKNVKGVSSSWMKSDPRFASFKGWAAEYYAATISPEQKQAVIEYIKGQKEHHLIEPFDEELPRMYKYSNLPYTDFDLR